MIHGPYNIKSVYLVGLHIYYKMIHGPYNIKFVYLVGLHIYYKMIHGPYNIELNLQILLDKNVSKDTQGQTEIFSVQRHFRDVRSRLETVS